MIKKIVLWVVSGCLVLLLISYTEAHNPITKAVAIGYLLALTSPLVTKIKDYFGKKFKRVPGVYPDGVVDEKGNFTAFQQEAR